MANKQQVIALHKAHPTWTARELAEELDCLEQYISACKRRYRLKIPRATTRACDPNNVMALGREARRAGLTVEMLQQIAQERQI